MSEELQEVATQVSDAEGHTAGQLLKQARETSGLHIAALAVAMKVPTRKLEALESDRYDELNGATFVRALAASVCRHLKMDSKPVLDRLPATDVPALGKVDEGLNTPFRKPGEMVTLGETWQKLRITVIAVVVLLLGSILIFSLPASWMYSGPEKPTPQVEATLQHVKPTDSIQQSPTLTLPASVSVSVVPPTDASPSSAVNGQSGKSVVSPESAASAAVKQNMAASAEKGAQASGFPNQPEVLVFRANADSWVEVLDRNGQLMVRKTIKSGETLPVGGQVPLSVTIGNADKTSVTVRGKPYDLLPVTRENIARFVIQ